MSLCDYFPLFLQYSLFGFYFVFLPIFNQYNNALIFQCWVVLACVQDLWVPVGWFLLPSKEYTVYKAVLQFLKEEHDITALEVCHLDFENAESKAMKEVFPNVRIVGCDFHFKQVSNLNIL